MSIGEAVPILLISLAALAASGFSETLKIRVSGYKPAEGNIAVAVFDDPRAFPRKGHLAKFKVSRPASGSEETLIEIAEVPPGEYAIAVFHDRNADGQLNTLFGLPREGFGFSNNARVVFGPPSFESARVPVDRPVQDLDIKIRYLF